jgi:hypothetical protein
MTSTKGRPWQEVTADKACEVCGKGDWCRRSPDGTKIACRREARGAVKVKRYKDGSEAYLHDLQPGRPRDDNGRPKRQRQASGLTPTPSGDGQDTVTKRDAGYRRLLALLPLSPDDRDNLRQRGLTDADVDAGGYRTLPASGRGAVVKKLAVELGQDFAAVPGFVMGERGPRIAAPSGLVVPVRDVAARVVALKLRPDTPKPDAGKYLYLSSAKYGGPGPGSPAHVPAGVCGPVDVARITEGELKADVATRLSGVPTLSFPGVSSWRVVLPVLQALGVKTVRVSFDADAAAKKEVARPLRECVKELQTLGYAVELERWPADAGKGIDDVLQAGHKADIETLAGPAALAAVEQIAKAAGVDDHGDDADGQRDERKSQATLLVELATVAELWHTTGQGIAYATLPVGDHREHWPIRSPTFRRWLGRRFFDEYGKAPGSQALQDAMTVIEGLAVFDGAEHPVFVRVAGHGDKQYLDLANDAWQAVEIDAAGWRLVAPCPVRFRRAKAMMPLPTPTAGGDIGELRRFVNVTPDDWPLLLGWLAAAFRPTGPYPVLALHGEQGAAKSTTARALRATIDPNAAPVRCEPREPRDLMIAAANGWVIALDNLSYVPGWLSDALCRLATGGGFATRTLYENDEETIFDAMRPCILTGIEELANRSDLLDRSLILQLPRIPDAKRRTEAEHGREFQQAHGRILGAVLEAVSAAVRSLPTTHIERLPRMADFAKWATAAESGLGLQPGEFLTAYRGNRDAANETALESSPVAKYVLQVADAGGWNGTPSDLLDRIESMATDGDKRLKTWPKNPRSLSGILKRLAPNLRAAGVEVEHGRDSGRQRKRVVTVKRTEADSCVRCVRTVRNAENNGVSADAADANGPVSDANADANRIDVNPGGATVRTQADGSDARLQPYSERVQVTL